MPTGKSAIRVFDKSAGKAVDSPICIPIKKYYSVVSSNDIKPIQTNNLAPTPQPMTAALIFRRQLVRRSPLNLQQTLSASKLQVTNAF
jgi:hypothetical protein